MNGSHTLYRPPNFDAIKKALQRINSVAMMMSMVCNIMLRGVKNEAEDNTGCLILVVNGNLYDKGTQRYPCRPSTHWPQKRDSEHIIQLSPHKFFGGVALDDSEGTTTTIQWYHDV